MLNLVEDTSNPTEIDKVLFGNSDEKRAMISCCTNSMYFKYQIMEQGRKSPTPFETVHQLLNHILRHQYQHYDYESYNLLEELDNALCIRNSSLVRKIA